jgi:hypothetical protein
MTSTRIVVRSAAATLAALAWLSGRAFAGELAVVAVEPGAHSLSTPVDSAITVQFDQPVEPATVTNASFRAFARWSGAVSGEFAFTKDNTAVTLTPSHPFSAGELVMVILSHDIAGESGTPLRSAGYSFQFWTEAQPAPLKFDLIDSMTTRTTPQESTRSYGGIASDLDSDGWLDLTIVNEDTADLRVFMNLADGSGLYADFIQPTFPVGDRASPSEPADFNNDGHVDICVANINVNSVSILLGIGDGTYAPQQLVTVGGAPRGICVLDADGDGDPDIVNTNTNSSNLSIMLNDGAGVFGPPAFFEGGGSGEWALAAADMDDDGILDLVVGARTSQLIIVQHGNGDGTFTNIESQSSGGQVWMLNTGDVNADGLDDVICANSGSNNGSVLLNTGGGQLAAPATYLTDTFPLATDIGDIDGDSDLDWMTSSFNGDWRLYLNDGAGAFSFDQEFNAPQAASCSLLLDFDNDGDLDLALIDELADVVILQKNSGTTVPPPDADLTGDGVVDAADLAELLAQWGVCGKGDPCTADLAPPPPGGGDGEVNAADLAELLANWT